MIRALQELMLFGTLVFGVAACGANPDWARYLFCTLVFCVSAFYLLTSGEPTPASRHGWIRALPFVLLAIPLIQVVPLPAGARALLSPVHAAMMRSLAGTGLLSDAMSHHAVSIHPFGTLEQMLVVLAAGAVFLAGRRLLPDPGSAWRLGWMFLGLGVFEALYGLLQYFGQAPYLFLSPGQTTVGGACGTYVNRNHFAGLLEMSFPMTFGLAYAHYLRRIQPEIARTRRRFLALATHPDLPVFGLLLFAAVWICLGVVFSLSRSGITSLLATILFMALLLGLRHSRRRVNLLVLVFLLAVGGYAAWIGMEEVLQRFEQLLQQEAILREGRMEVWRDTLDLINDFPLLGVGLGNYQYAFHRYSRVPRSVIYDHAHNDYLEYLAEWGIPGGLLLFAAVIGLFGMGMVAFFRTEDPGRRGLLLGACGGIFSLLLHSATDFNLQIPANLALFALLLSAVAAAAKGTRTELMEPDEPEDASGEP